MSGKTWQQLLAESKGRKRIAEEAALGVASASVEISSVASALMAETPRLLESTIAAIASAPGAISSGGLRLNAAQQAFVNLMDEPPGPPRILVGPAGSGKTTTVGFAIDRLMGTQAMVPIPWDHKHLPAQAPGIILCAFTRRATNNIRKRLAEDLQGNCITIHKVLEFEPEYFEVEDKKNGGVRTSMQFTPRRDRDNKLPAGLRYIFIDEYSMLGTELFRLLLAALPDGVQIIFVGDIYQLPPVMDSSAIAPYLCVSPTIELTEVYRTALDNPIISYATKIRKGEIFEVPERLELFAPNGIGKLTLHPWKLDKQGRRPGEETAMRQLGNFFQREYNSGEYDPADCQILMPWGERLGSLELCRYVATAIAKKHGRPVFEVIAGIGKKYFSVGDMCMFDKSDCTILKIERNPAFTGNFPADAMVGMDYWGHVEGKIGANAMHPSESMDDIEKFLAAATSSDIGEGQRVKQCSHKITVEIAETGGERVITGAGDVNLLELSYAMTVHKAQGSEWRKVYLCTHKLHQGMLNRELLYTAFTRAKQELYVICESDTFVHGVRRQALSGDTLEEKAKNLRFKATMAAGGLKK